MLNITFEQANLFLSNLISLPVAIEGKLRMMIMQDVRLAYISMDEAEAIEATIYRDEASNPSPQTPILEDAISAIL